MDWVVSAFEHGFQQRALVAGALAVVTTSLVGTWVVLRGLSFMGDALAHGVLPGIALGILLGFDPTLGAILSALAMVAGINLVHRTSRLTEDTGIGLLFVGMLALGVVLISRTSSYTGSLTGILFGDVLGASRSDILLLAASAVIALGASLVLYRAFLALSFNQQKATMLGLYPRFAHAAMLGLVTMTVVASFRTVGALLVFGLLVAPPATAALLARRVPTMMIAAVVFGLVSVVAGLLISYHFDTAGSATMAGVAVLLFFLVLTVTRLVGRRTG